MTGSPRVELYDTTLRDGAQGTGVSYSIDDRLRILHKLDQLGVPFVEGGWPGANPRETEFFRLATGETLKHAALTAFGMTRKAGESADASPVLRHVLDAGTEVVCLVGKSWDLHVTQALRTDLDEGELARIAEVCREQKFAMGQYVFKEGEPGNRLFIIAEGEVRISRTIPGSGEEALAVLKPGAVFGEMAIFDRSERSTDAIANTSCMLPTCQVIWLIVTSFDTASSPKIAPSVLCASRKAWWSVPWLMNTMRGSASRFAISSRPGILEKSSWSVMRMPSTRA